MGINQVELSLLNLFSHSASEVSLCEQEKNGNCSTNPYPLLSFIFPQTEQKHFLCTITSSRTKWNGNSAVAAMQRL